MHMVMVEAAGPFSSRRRAVTKLPLRHCLKAPAREPTCGFDRLEPELEIVVVGSERIRAAMTNITTTRMGSAPSRNNAVEWGVGTLLALIFAGLIALGISSTPLTVEADHPGVAPKHLQASLPAAQN
jgi:hypothetical protein